ncbi:MAG TPA: NAD(P)-dependent oxidoreductase [Nitrospiraceae bacterium]|nr:NAD(P)-dependent oxidoreductase [Nitrospiraceae bacterium]
MKEDFRVGFVGVGRMGANMARRLKDEEYSVTSVYDLDSQRSRALAEELGCEAAPLPARIAEQSNIVITVVTDDEAMRRIYAEDWDGSLLQYSQGRLFINCATVSPRIHVQVEALAKQHGAESLEVCMASSIPQARQGTLYLMCSGTKEAFDRARPLLESLSASLRYIGKAGEAAKVKALVNMVMNINTAALAEGLGLGAALGLDLTMLREVFAQTGAASRVLETDGEDMQHRTHDCYFSAAHAAKDCAIALRLAETVGLTTPLATVTFQQYRRLVQIGKGELDKSGIAELTFPGRSSSASNSVESE